jgi:iron complex transport system substrate-binding protein
MRSGVSPARLLALAAWLFATHVHAALSVTDDSGATVTLDAPAQRVVSLAPHVTELLFAAGGGARVVGAVSYSDYPPQAKAIPRVGDNKALDLERIVAMKPDLIDRLRALHVPLYFSDPRKLEDIASTMDKLGTLLGTERVAALASGAFRRDLAALRARYAARPTVDVFYQVWDDPLMTLNGQSVVSEVIGVCGGRNVFAGLGEWVPTVSTEAVVAADPEVMVTAVVGETAPAGRLPGLDGWRKWTGMTAVARGNLFGIDGDWINRPTARVLMGAEVMCRDLDVARGRRR